MTNRLPRMRTIPKAYEEVKAADPQTSFTIRALRRLIKCGDIQTVRVGNKNLINLDLLFDYLSCYNNGAINVDLVSAWFQGGIELWQPLKWERIKRG